MNIFVLEAIKEIKKIEGYLGAAIFSEDGLMLGGVTEVMGMNFEIAGTLFNNIFIIAKNASLESGFGILDMVQLNSEKGIILCKTFRRNGDKLSVVFIINKGANIVMARLKMEVVIESLKNKFN